MFYMILYMNFNFNGSHPVVLLIFNKMIHSVLAQHQYIIINALA